MTEDRAAYAKEQLEAFRTAYALQQQATGSNIARNVPLTEWGDPQIERALETARSRIKLVLDEIAPGWRTALSKKGFFQSEDAFLDRYAADQMTMLTEGDEIRQRLRGDADELVAETLHPWVWTDEVTRRWHKGEFADAVDEASKSVNAAVQAKVGRPDLGEVKLFRFIYGQGEPAPGAPRLVFNEANPMTERDRREGAMNLAAGWFTAVRNLLAHLAGMNIERHQALEYLAALSIVARWSAEAAVSTGPTLDL